MTFALIREAIKNSTIMDILKIIRLIILITYKFPHAFCIYNKVQLIIIKYVKLTLADKMYLLSNCIHSILLLFCYVCYIYIFIIVELCIA